ncbi:hypothetical protein IWX90DRAFT_234555 [Phyllosticta citrichinensis]|uniref:Uncharacterized protein n=1 Tax=Phyllosticta citrichinensis TaxID=1130410 RepID=A0ABR1XPP2_9PEZI
MPPKPEAQGLAEVTELLQQLHTAECELNLARSQAQFDSVAKDESIRELKFCMMLLEDENEQLHNDLDERDTKYEELEGKLDDAFAQVAEKDAEVQRSSHDLRIKTREFEAAKAQLASMEHISSDSNKILTEKLALARELSALKPELEHLRSQLASQDNVIAEKLSLQRQLDAAEVELENERRATQRALARSERYNEKDAELQTQIESLRKELYTERKEREKAVKETAKAQKDFEAAQEAADREKSRRDKELEKEAAKDAQEEGRLEELQKELVKERREREKAEKAIQKVQMEAEGQTSLATERAEAYKSKLKTTKEKLKEAQADLQRLHAQGTARPTAMEGPKAVNPRKRALQADPDATTIGTPGDGPTAKRLHRASSMLGDKSTFSMTPFLKRTGSVAPESPIQEVNEEVEGVEQSIEEVVERPAKKTKKVEKAARAQSAEPQPLAPAPSSKANTKSAPRRKKAVAPALEKVAEEASDDEEPENQNTDNRAGQDKLKVKDANAKITTLKPKMKTAKQPRKSLAAFPNFHEESAPLQKKKRKLGGESSILGKTLFDIDDEEDRPAKPLPGKGIFAARALNKTLGQKGGAAKGPTVMTSDGFAFSPLKKERRAIQASFLQSSILQ